MKFYIIGAEYEHDEGATILELMDDKSGQKDSIRLYGHGEYAELAEKTESGRRAWYSGRLTPTMVNAMLSSAERASNPLKLERAPEIVGLGHDIPEIIGLGDRYNDVLVANLHDGGQDASLITALGGANEGLKQVLLAIHGHLYTLGHKGRHWVHMSDMKKHGQRLEFAATPEEWHPRDLYGVYIGNLVGGGVQYYPFHVFGEIRAGNMDMGIEPYVRKWSGARLPLLPTIELEEEGN